jgi:protein SCO1/2
MKRGARISIVLAALCTVAAIAVLLLPSALPTSLVSANQDASLSFRPHPGAQLPLATKFADESGREVPLGSYFTASPVILVLDYLRCTSLCGVTLRSTIEALDKTPLAPGRDYQIVAVSIDPRDKPADATAARKEYAALLHRAEGDTALHFLTGSTEAAKAVADAVGFPYRYDRLLDAYIHPAGFVVATPAGVISRYVEGIAGSGQELMDAFADARQNKSQDLLTRLILLCHVQGAPLGRFTVPVLAAFMAAEIAAALAALAIFTTVRRRGG